MRVRIPHRLVAVWAAVFCLAGSVLTPAAEAAFLDNGFGARPVGMGGAFTAVADDTNAPLFNPAGITQVQWNQISAMYARLFSGLTLYAGPDTVHLNQSYVSYVAKPIPKWGSFGVSWSNFNTTSLYREDAVALTYARSLGDFIPALDKTLSIGTNLKYLRRSITLDERTLNDPVFAGGSDAGAFSADVGVLYAPDEGALEGVRIGLTGKNLNQPDVGFGEKDLVPVEWRLGLAYHGQAAPWLIPSVDLARRNGETNVYGGAEAWLFQDALGLRAGANRDEGAAGISYYQRLKDSFGFRLDYGFTFPYRIEGSDGSHRLAVTLYF